LIHFYKRVPGAICVQYFLIFWSAILKINNKNPRKGS